MKNTVCVILGAVAIALASSGCASLAEVQPISAANNDSRYLKYSLPRTVLTVAVPIKQTEYKPSRFLPGAKSPMPLPAAITDWDTYVAYLQRELDIRAKDVVLPRPADYSLVNKEVVLGSRPEPDPDATYVVKLRADGFQDLKLDVDLGENGQLQAVTNTMTHKGVETAIKAVETAIGLAAKFAGSSPKSSKTTLFEDRIEQVRQLREGRTNIIINGITAVSAEHVKLILDSIQAAEKAILDDLLGTTATTVWTAQFTFAPEKNFSGDQTLLELDPLRGITLKADADNRLLDPFGFDPQRAEKEEIQKLLAALQARDAETHAALLKTLTLKLHLSRHASSPAIMPLVTGTPRIDTGSFYYRNPGRGHAYVQLVSPTKTTTLTENILWVAQYGEIRQLPRKLGGISNALTLSLYPDTGAIKKVTTSATQADAKGGVDAIGAKVSAYIDADQKSDDELTALQREHTKLKLQSEMVGFQKTISTAPAP